MKSLAEAIPEEQARVRELLVAYKEIGPVGTFGATMIEISLKAADKAVMSGDVVQMLKAYDDLKGITG